MFVHGNPPEAATTTVSLPDLLPTNTPNASAGGRTPNNVHRSRRRDEPSHPRVDCRLARVRVLRGPQANNFQRPEPFLLPTEPVRGICQWAALLLPCLRMDRREFTISVPASVVVVAIARVEHADGAIPPRLNGSSH